MVNREKVIKGLECCILRDPDDHARCSQCSYGGNCVNRLKIDALSLLKAQEVMPPDEFKNELLKMFSSIWDCEIDHPMFQDTVGELMSAVMQLYTQAVKWNK